MSIYRSVVVIAVKVKLFPLPILLLCIQCTLCRIRLRKYEIKREKFVALCAAAFAAPSIVENALTLSTRVTLFLFWCRSIWFCLLYVQNYSRSTYSPFLCMVHTIGNCTSFKPCGCYRLALLLYRKKILIIRRYCTLHPPRLSMITHVSSNAEE